MKIELVGGPACGAVKEVTYLDQRLFFAGVGTYARRDRAFTLSDRHGACYGQSGHRMYDYDKNGE